MGNCCCCNSRSASDRLDSYSGFGLSLASSAKREPPCVSHAYLLLDSARPGHIQLSPAGRRQFAQDSCWSEYQLCIYFSGKLFGLFKCWLAGFFANVYYNTAWSTARVEVDLVSYKANRIIYTDAVFFHLCFSYLSTLFLDLCPLLNIGQHCNATAEELQGFSKSLWELLPSHSRLLALNHSASWCSSLLNSWFVIRREQRRSRIWKKHRGFAVWCLLSFLNDIVLHGSGLRLECRCEEHGGFKPSEVQVKHSNHLRMNQLEASSTL